MDEDGSNEIHFAEFLKIIEAHKASNNNDGDDTDTLEAFVALGGGADKTGGVTVETLSGLTEVHATNTRCPARNKNTASSPLESEKLL